MQIASPSSLNGKGRAATLVCDGFIALADDWIARATNADATSWFRETIDRIRRQPRGDVLATAIGLAPRRLGKADLVLTSDDRARATELRRDIDPGEWSVDQTARIAFMAASYAGDDTVFAASFDEFARPPGSTS